MCWSEGQTRTLTHLLKNCGSSVPHVLLSSRLTFDPSPFLCHWLQVNMTLKQLDLSYNGFGNIGAQALGEALHHNSTLVLLDVGSNRISDEGTRVLFQGLATNDSLRVLRVGGSGLLSWVAGLFGVGGRGREPELELDCQRWKGLTVCCCLNT